MPARFTYSASKTLATRMRAYTVVSAIIIDAGSKGVLQVSSVYQPMNMSELLRAGSATILSPRALPIGISTS